MSSPIEFLEPDDRDGSGVDDLHAARPRRLWWLVLAATVGVLSCLVVVSHALRSTPRAAAPTSAPASTAPPPPTPTTRVPRDPVGRVAPRPVAAATAAVCRSQPRCAVSRDEGLARSARRALGETVDLQVRVVTPARAVIVSSLSPSGARLLIVVSAPALRLNAADLFVPPPFGVQSQRNGPDNVLAVASGSTASVALLSTPTVQRWLGALRLPR